MKKLLRKLTHKISRQGRIIQRIRRGILEKKSSEGELIHDLKQAERIVKRKRWRRRWLSNPDHRPHWSESKREQRREELADQIEEWEAVVDETIEALDKLDRRKTRARRELERRKDRRDRLRKRRAKIAAQLKEKEADEGNNRLSKHFVRAEFQCRDGTDVPDEAMPALRSWCLNIGEPAREKGGTIGVNSGYRTAGYNAAIGGASNSVHIYDRHPGAVAVDHTSAGLSPAALANFEDGLPEASGLGRYSSFCHSDNRHRIGWPRSRWWG